MVKPAATKEVQVVPVSAVVLTYNEEANIEATLNGLSGWCEEIHVVDSGSTDRTVEIATKHGVKLYTHRYVDHSSQWAWVFETLQFAHDWVLMVDADFILTEQLREQITEALTSGPVTIVGYYIHHRYVFRGQPIRFGGTKKWWLRLVRRDRVRVERSELVDFRVRVDGATGKLYGIVYEVNRKEYEIDFWVDKHQQFSTRLAAEEILRRSGRLRWNMGGSIWGDSEERRIWMKERWNAMPRYLRPFVYFGLRYFVFLGFLDGWRGFLFHFLQGFWFRLIVDIKIGEYYRRMREGRLTIDGIYELSRQGQGDRFDREGRSGEDIESTSVAVGGNGGSRRDRVRLF